jgi:hypothetical protein
MLEIISPRHTEIITERVHEWLDKTGNFGHSYPVDENDNYTGNCEEGRANFLKDKAAIEIKALDGTLLIDQGVKVEKRYFTANAVGKCHCGQQFELVRDYYYGAIDCPKCGQWYNMAGQELLPPDEWEGITEDELCY